MRKFFRFIGSHSVSVSSVVIISIAVFASSVYGFAEVASVNSSKGKMPEVKELNEFLQESVTPTPSPAPKKVNAIKSNTQDSSTPTLTPSNSPTSNKNKESNKKEEIKKAESNEAKKTSETKIELDKDLEDTKEEDSSERTHERER